MAFDGSSQNDSVDSYIDMAGVFIRTVQTRATLLEDLFFSLKQSFSRTDVAIVLHHGPVIKIHKFVLCLSEVMRQRIQDAEQDEPRRMHDDHHLRIDLPEYLQLCPTIQVIFLLYLGHTIYSEVNSMKLALSWFGISEVPQTRIEEQPFIEDYESKQMRKFERFSVPYTMDGVEYTMDVEGNYRPTGCAVSYNNVSHFRLFCSACGTVFTTYEQLGSHRLATKCPPKSWKLLNKKAPAVQCISCGSLYARLVTKRGVSSSFSRTPRYVHPNCFESFEETHCHLCLSFAATPATGRTSTPKSSMPYSPEYCFKCLLVFETEQDERDHDVGCLTVLGKGPVGRLNIDTCKIQNCGMTFVEAPSLNDGIYHHTDIVHNLIKYKAYAIHSRPICIVCGVKKGASNHNVESAGDYLLNVFNCYKAKEKRMKRKPPLKTQLLPEISIEGNLESPTWYLRLNIHREETQPKTNKKKNQGKNRTTNTQAEVNCSKLAGQPVIAMDVQDCVGKKPVTCGHGSKAAANQPAAANQKRKNNPKGKTVDISAKTGTADSRKKK